MAEVNQNAISGTTAQRGRPVLVDFSTLPVREEPARF
jgi:hypothetical protein